MRFFIILFVIMFVPPLLLYGEKSYFVYRSRQKSSPPNLGNKMVEDLPRIKMSEFEKFYNINPESWNLKNCRVYKTGKQELSFTFSYSDYKKYLTFKKKVQKRKKTEEKEKAVNERAKFENSMMIELLKEVQKDVDDIKAKVAEDRERVKKETEDIKLRLSTEGEGNKSGA